MDFIMKKKIKGRRNKLWAVCITGIMLFIISACGRIKADENLIPNDDKERKIINLFGPMEKSKPNVSNIARTAFDLTVEMAEEKFDLTVRYRTYTAENYQEKTYDDVHRGMQKHYCAADRAFARESAPQIYPDPLRSVRALRAYHNAMRQY